MSVLEPTTEERLADVLSVACESTSLCKGPDCQAVIYWIRSRKSGNLVPYDITGKNHFVSCPDRDRFKQGRH